VIAGPKDVRPADGCESPSRHAAAECTATQQHNMPPRRMHRRTRAWKQWNSWGNFIAPAWLEQFFQVKSHWGVGVLPIGLHRAEATLHRCPFRVCGLATSCALPDGARGLDAIEEFAHPCSPTCRATDRYGKNQGHKTCTPKRWPEMVMLSTTSWKRACFTIKGCDEIVHR
jgi:hypothetical protein